MKLRRNQVTNVAKKHSMSSELAQKMAGAAVAKAREMGVSESVAILVIGSAGLIESVPELEVP
jgi:uncharacterized protein GlcG (DUF336 family)